MAIYESTYAAQRDWQEIVEYTIEQHGVKQTEKYTTQLLKCIEAMTIGKGHHKDIEIEERIVRVKHCQKHYIFGLVRDGFPFMVIAFSHERMDLMARLKGRLE